MLTRLSAHCYVLPYEERTDRPALGYVRGAARTMQIDVGNSPAHVAKMLRALADRGLPSPDLAALTHFHWDHTFGLCAMTCPAIACAATDAQLAAMSRWEWSLPAMEARVRRGEELAFCHEHQLLEYEDVSRIRVVRPSIVYEARLRVALGDCTAELMKLPNSHTEDSCAVLIAPDGVLFLGDTAYEDLTHDPGVHHAEACRALIRALTPLDFTVVVCGHQPPQTREELFAELTEALAGAGE